MCSIVVIVCCSSKSFTPLPNLSVPLNLNDHKLDEDGCKVPCRCCAAILLSLILCLVHLQLLEAIVSHPQVELISELYLRRCGLNSDSAESLLKAISTREPQIISKIDLSENDVILLACCCSLTLRMIVSQLSKGVYAWARCKGLTELSMFDSRLSEFVSCDSCLITIPLLARR